MARPVIIDTDPGIDDALALLYAFASPELTIEAITVAGGNIPLAEAVRNTLLITEAAALETPPPIYAGAKRPLRQEPTHAAHVHHEDGLGGVVQGRTPRLTVSNGEAADAILRNLKARPREVTIIGLAPLTNLALAFERDPETFRLAREIVVMGGALESPGNVTAAAEFNFYADPDAAQIVLTAGVPVTVVGLDVTYLAPLDRTEFERRAAESSTEVARFAAEICAFYFDFLEHKRNKAECYLHDPLAVAAAADPTLVRTRSYQAEVETEGRLTRGMLVADRRGGAQAGPVKVAVALEQRRFLDLFLDRVCPR